MRIHTIMAISLLLAANSSRALPWMEDDLNAAIARAKTEHKPIFVDAWAPWCHACLSMTEFVFSDKSIEWHAGKYVWLAVNTEKPAAAAFLARFEMKGWPTYFVLDEKGALIDRVMGTMALADVQALLLRHEGGAASPNDTVLQEAIVLAAKGDHKTAAARAKTVVDAAPKNWSRRAEAVDFLVNELAASDDVTGCAEVAQRELHALGNGGPAFDVAATLIDCVQDKPRTDLGLARLLEILNDPKTPLSADDRSDGWNTVAETRGRFGDKEGARLAQETRRALLEKAAKGAPDAKGRVVFEAHLVDTYIALAEAGRALPMLALSEKDFPDDYNHPARLSRVLMEVGKKDAALEAIDRAIKLCYGPRLLRLYTAKADVQKARGDAAGEKAALEAALAAHAALSAEHRAMAQKPANKLKQRLATLGQNVEKQIK